VSNYGFGNTEKNNELLDVLVWDSNLLSPKEANYTILWTGSENPSSQNELSISKLVESNADYYKKRYLSLVYSLGLESINGKSIIEHLKLEDNFSFWWMTLIPAKDLFYKSSHIEDIMRFMAFDNWAESHFINKLTLVSGNSILSECFKLWCARSNVKFNLEVLEEQHTKTQNPIRKIYNSIPLSIQGSIWLIRRIINCIPLWGLGVEQWKKSKGKITFVSYLSNLNEPSSNKGKFKSHFWGELPEVTKNESQNTNWLHMFIEDNFVANAKIAANTIRNFNNLAKGEQVHVLLESFLSWNVVLRTIQDWYRLSKLTSLLDQYLHQKKDHDIEFWPFLSDELRQSLVGKIAVANILYFHLYKSALKSLPKQKLGIYLQENQSWEMGMIHLWKSSGHGKLIGHTHSTVRYWDLRYFYFRDAYYNKGIEALPMPDKVAVNGNNALNALKEHGYPVSDLLEVEALRYLHLDAVKSDNLEPFKSSKEHINLLVLGDYSKQHTHFQMVLLESIAAKIPKNVTITLKPHPACPINSADYPRIKANVSTEFISNLLKKCDLVFTSSSTSSAVDAYYFGKRVISAHNPKHLNQSPLRNNDEVFFVSNPDELLSKINKILTDGLTGNPKQDFFYIDISLPRWRKVLLYNMHNQ
jgi:surface carbohydrate biosynthesis protein (TIGR04326 family)